MGPLTGDNSIPDVHRCHFPLRTYMGQPVMVKLPQAACSYLAKSLKSKAIFSLTIQSHRQKLLNKHQHINFHTQTRVVYILNIFLKCSVDKFCYKHAFGLWFVLMLARFLQRRGAPFSPTLLADYRRLLGHV